MLTRNIRRLMLLVMMCCGMAVTNAQTSYNLSVTSEGGGTISYMTPTASGMVNANESNVFTVYEGEELQLTFTPSNDAYKLVAATVNGTNVMGDMTGNTYTISSVSGDITVYGGFDIAIKNGTVLTEVIDGIEWTYTVTDDVNKRCQLGGVDSLNNSITAVPTSTVAADLAIPSVINGYTVYGLCVQAFYGCSGLTGQLNIPETVTFIGDQTFQGTNFSGTLTLPSGLNNLCSYSFYNLYNLTGDLVIPESLTVLPAYAFFNCQGFTSLTLPAGVTNLWTRCFGQMSGLKQITCYATTPPTIGAENVFSDYTIPLFVPAESVDAYKAAQYWSNFTNIYAIGTVLNHTLTVASSGGGKFVGAIKNLTGEIYSEFESNPDSDDPVEFPVTVPVGYSVEMTFTPNTGYYLYRVMKNDMEEISGQMVDNKLTLTDVNEDMKVSAEFLRTQLLLQVNSQTTYGTTNWEVTDVLGGGTVTSGTVQNEVQDVPVFYGSTVKVTFTYDQTQYGLSQLLRGTTDILGNLAADGSYTITNYTKTDTITVSFAELPTEAYAALDGNTLTFYYDKQKAARGGMSVGPFTSSLEPGWVNNSSAINAVVFDSSFADCTDLTSTAYWFGCANLSTITGMENLNTSNVTSMYGMFWGCESLTNVDVSGFNTANVTDMSFMFNNCSSLTSLNLSSFDTGKVTTMQDMFHGCSALTTLDLSNFNTDNVTTTYGMFQNCTALTDINLSNANTENVTNMNYMFHSCNLLESIIVGSGWNTDKVTSGDIMFSACNALVGGKGTQFNPGFIDVSRAHIDGGASNPGYLTDVNAPTSYNIKVTVVGSGTVTAGETTVNSGSEQEVAAATGSSMILAFTPDAGYRLATVKVDSTDVTSQVIADSTGVSYYTLTGIYDVHTVTATFVNDTKEAYVVLSNDNTVMTFYYDTYKADRGGWSVLPSYNSGSVRLWSDNVNTITTVVFDESFADYTDLTSTAYWFYFCNNLTTITGLQNVATANVTSTHAMFYGCSSLTSLDLSNFNTANVTDMSSMFYGCSALTSLDLSNFNTANVTNMGSLFNGCSSLTSLDLNGFNTANVTDMSWMFYGCSGLTNLVVNSFNTGNVTSMNHLFDGCSALTSLDVSSFNTSNVTDMESMFAECSSLTTLDLSSFSTANVTNMQSLFIDCGNLTTIYVGENWSTASVTYGNDMFYVCSSLVGGKGTLYDYGHVGLDYAHIDGGAANPGYLTPQGGYVEAPTFTWNGDDLTMTTGTDGATIYYTMVETSSPTAAPTAVQYTSPVTVTSDVLITAYAEKEGMAQSPSTVLNYPYTAWKALADAIADAQTVSAQAATNDNVTDTQRTELTDMINLSQGMYDARVDSASVINQQTTNLTTLTTTIQQLVNAEAEPYAVLSNDGTVVTFYYDKKKQERKGVDINNANTGYAPYYNVTTAVIDASFADYHPTSTACWFRTCNKLTSIEGIANLNTDNVTDMSNMFEGCYSLTSLDLSNFNTANVTNMFNMFFNCSGLTTLDLSSFNTTKMTDMSNMFIYCSGLTNLNLSSFNTANVTSMKSMFRECSNLKSIDLSNFDTENVTDMTEMFRDCSSLTELDLSSFNTANVTSMGDMFWGCAALDNVNVNSFNTAKVKTMSGMFRACSSLVRLDLSSFNTANLTGMPYMFEGCHALTTIKVGDEWNTAFIDNVSSRDMFIYCTALVGGKGTVYDADHVDGAYAHIDGGAANPGYFTDINAPTTYTVTVDVFGGGSVTAGGETITEYTDYNREVSVDAGGSLLLTFTPAADHRLATVLLDGTDVMSQVITDSTGVSYYTLTSIYDDHTVTATFVDATIEVVGNTDLSSAWWTAFSSNYEIPANYTLHMQFTNHSDKVNNWDNWVLMCTADSTRTPEYFALRADGYGWGDKYNASGLTYSWTDWDAFREDMDGALVDLTVRRWGGELTVTSVAKAADDTEYVQTLTLTIDSVADQSVNVFLTVEKAYLEIYKNSITLTPSEAPATPEAYAVLSGDGLTVTFYYDTQKTERGGIDINNDNSSLYGSATTAVIDASFADYYPTSTAYWFMNCSNLTSIEGMANLNTGNVTNMRYMFNGCSGLTSLDLSSFNTANVTDMGYMFSYCSGLTSLDLSNFNTANVMYMSEMFSSCSSLATLDLSNFNTSNVTSMHSMFTNCSSLTTLDLSSFNTANVTDMSNMFQVCSSLTSLDLSSFNTANVTTMYFMLSYCSNLTTIYVGEGWSTENVTQSGGMFYDCTALVGYMGTTYDVNNIDASYAHIDGGTANPGYLSRILQKGDANGDGEVNIADAVAAVAYILATGDGYFSTDMADMNDDSEIDIFDVTMIVNAALAANNTGGSRDMAVPSNISRIAAEDIRLTAAANRVSVGVERVEQFTAFQFDVTLPEGTELVGVKLSTGATDHQLSFVKRGDGQYRVVGLSMSNEVCYSPDGNQLQLQLSGATGSDGVRVSNMLFVNPVAKDATGIRQPTAGAAQDGGYYDLNGRYMGTDRRQLNKGMYIKNHKKVIIK